MSESSERQELMRQFREQEDGQISLLWMVAVLVRERRTILFATAGGIAIGLGIALLSAATYTTSFSFVPQASESNTSGLASLAGQFGVSLGDMSGQGRSPQFYADLLETGELLAPVAKDSFPPALGARPVRLTEFMKALGSTDAEVVDRTVKMLRAQVVKTDVAPRNTGVVTVTVQTTSPTVSLGIAQQLLEGLNKFNLATRQSQAAAERKFAEGRLEAFRGSLRAAEDALQRFQQSNRIASSPELTIQRGRLERDVAMQQQLVTGLLQQYEEARIREVRDTPVITVVERPSIASRPDPRGRLLTVVAGFSVAFLLAVSYVLARDAIARRDATDPAVSLLASEWRRVRRKRES